MATSSQGTTSGTTTPSGQTPGGSTPESEKNSELQEYEKILSPDFLSRAQITDLLAEDASGVEEKLGILLNFKNLKTCLKDAILIDYYVSGFLWAKETDFSLDQFSKFMTLLDMLLQNLKTLHMSLEDSIKWLGEVMAEIGPTHSQMNEDWHIFDAKQANAIIDYLKISLFQHYRLYEFMFYSTRTEIVIGAETSLEDCNHEWEGNCSKSVTCTVYLNEKQPESEAMLRKYAQETCVELIEVVKSADHPFPVPLEEGMPLDIFSAFIEPMATSDTDMKGLDQEQGPQESQPESDTSEVDPLAGFTIEDVKSVLAQVTEDVLTGIQTQITEKLQIQEEAFNARIEKLKKA